MPLATNRVPSPILSSQFSTLNILSSTCGQQSVACEAREQKLFDTPYRWLTLFVVCLPMPHATCPIRPCPMPLPCLWLASVIGVSQLCNSLWQGLKDVQLQTRTRLVSLSRTHMQHHRAGSSVALSLSLSLCRCRCRSVAVAVCH